MLLVPCAPRSFAMSVIWVLIYVLTSCPSQGAKILGVLSSDSKSRYFNLRNVADELAARGHKVSLLLSSAIPYAPSDKVTHLVFQSPFGKDHLEETIVPETSKKSVTHILGWSKLFIDVFTKTCRSLLVYVKDNLREFLEFELIFADSPPSCGVFVSDLLGKPRIDIAPAFFMRLNAMEMGPISYIPAAFSFNTNKMNFFQRMENLVYYIAKRLTEEIIGNPSIQELRNELNIKPERSFEESNNMAELVLIAGHFALEYPQPILPGIKLVGPLTITPVKPLPPDLEEFVNGAGDKGIVLLSLGTLGDHVLEKHQVNMFANVLGRLEQRVIWRLKRYRPENLAPNIKIVSWIPQTDLLAHNSTRVFLSHAGHNSMYESAYYSVPLVCIPLYGDQFSNCMQAQSAGIALAVDVMKATEESLYHSIKRILKETSFIGNATRISRLLRDSPRTSIQQAADWIEYVDRHKGAKHLRPELFNLHWYQKYLVDIIAFIGFILLVIVCILSILVKCFCDILIKRARKTENVKRD